MRNSFWLGLSTQISKPKTAVVYASVFAAFLPAHVAWPLALALLVAVFVLEAGWYAVVAALFSAAAPRRAYLRGKGFIDRLAGAVMIGLGVRLVVGATRA